jgi:hypothetical protein
MVTEDAEEERAWLADHPGRSLDDFARIMSEVEHPEYLRWRRERYGDSAGRKVRS